MLQGRERLQEHSKQLHNFWMIVDLEAWIWWRIEYNIQYLIWWGLLLIANEGTTYLLLQAAEVGGQQDHNIGPGWVSSKKSEDSKPNRFETYKRRWWTKIKLNIPSANQCCQQFRSPPDKQYFQRSGPEKRSNNEAMHNGTTDRRR